jgi:hypothetical protein
VGLNGTVVSLPQCEHTVRVSALAKLPFGGAAPKTASRFVLQILHRLGGFLNCLSWKNDCSPAVNVKSAPQSIHCNCLSRNSIEEMLPSFHSPAISVCSEEVGLAARTEAQELGSSPSIVLKTTLDSAHHASEAWIQRRLQTKCAADLHRTQRDLRNGPEGRQPGRGGLPITQLN